MLPANTSFIDDCISDRRSALGSFAVSCFPSDSEQFNSLVLEKLSDEGITADNDGNYPPGTTVVISRLNSFHYPIIITASTIRHPTQGIFSNLQTICRSIEQIFTATANQRIGQIRMPLIGCGHGGILPKISLTIILIAIASCVKKYHHIDSVNICVLDRKLVSSSLLKNINNITKSEG